MSDLQMTLRREIAFGVMRKHDNTVADVVFYRVNVPTDRVDPNAAVELNVRLCARNHTLRFGARRARRRIIEAVEYPNTPRVTVLEENLIEPHVDANGSVNRIFVEDVANRGPRDFGRVAGLLPGGKYGCFLKSRKQILVLKAGSMIRTVIRCFR